HELRQKVAVKSIHHAADADEDRDAQHDAADRYGGLALARPEVRESDGERQRRQGATRTACPSRKRSGGSRMTLSVSLSPATISVFAGPTAPARTSTRRAR